MARERLQKVLARAGVASRREAEALISAGRVLVNGARPDLGAAADPEVDRIEVDGVLVTAAPAAVHYAVHKPRGMLSSARDERGRASVLRLIPNPPPRLWPAGRLDADSEGLMILTNDGEWANRMIHPRYGLEREYAAHLDRMPGREAVARLLRGVELEDGPARLLSVRAAAPPSEVERPAPEAGIWVRATVAEGRKREVRRLFAAAGCDVLRLVRIRMGPLRLDGLRAGEWRRLSPSMVGELAGGGKPRRGRQPDDARERLSITIDGPSGAGKSTVGRALARRMGATFIDTGLMYRALTLAALHAGISPDDGPGLEALATTVQIAVSSPADSDGELHEVVLLDGNDVTTAVRDREVERAVSSVSRHAGVRAAMVAAQRVAAREGRVVMAGRDIGTVVLPDADLKIFLTASSAVRAERRAAEMGQPQRVAEYRAEIEERDARDSGREVAPLRVPEGALVLDTGELSVARCVNEVIARLRRRAPPAGRGEGTEEAPLA